ncbi:hypothetical protein [Bradyrhizobium sp. IAR9]|uniref:hypothetical protein n=1 Tax=Bradyrhizobium sp. IAR9 TaxID=2663841 RepID=UPI00390C5F56
MLDDAHRLQEAGCFALVFGGHSGRSFCSSNQFLDNTDDRNRRRPGLVQARCSCFTTCWAEGHRPKFVRAYAEGFQQLRDALSRWAADVRGGAFPRSQESYRLPEGVGEAITNWAPSNPT